MFTINNARFLLWHENVHRNSTIAGLIVAWILKLILGFLAVSLMRHVHVATVIAACLEEWMNINDRHVFCSVLAVEEGVNQRKTKS